MTARGAVIVAIAAVFAVAGVLHFTHTDVFAAIVPAPLPDKPLIVRVTGFVELVLAAGLLPRKTRRPAGFALALYCLAVLPANVQMALDPALSAGFPPWALWLRVALQFPLIALILWATVPRAAARRTAKARP